MSLLSHGKLLSLVNDIFSKNLGVKGTLVLLLQGGILLSENFKVG